MMEDIEELVRLHNLFDVVKDYVLASGGDGDGWMIIKGDYKKVADLFEAYEKETSNNWFTTRHDGKDGITFCHDQEFIWIGSRIDGLLEWAGDIIVCIFWNCG